MASTPILPGTGRGTMRSMVEGQPQAVSLRGCPSVTATRRHLPVPGRICEGLRTLHFVHFHGRGASA